MQVRKTEKADDTSTLVQLEFAKTTEDDDFKGAVKQWLQKNYPKMTYSNIFDRLILLNDNNIILSMS